MTDLRLDPTSIPGLLILTLPVHRDNRGWFKENWQRTKMVALGLPDFTPVQNNVSFNNEAGVARGMHAEPWDKLVSVTAGRAFGAWVDLRSGPTFGTVCTVELEPGTAVFVPLGVANGYQTLEPGTAYSYLVNKHWSASARESYRFVNLADPALGIPWPIEVDTALLSEADRTHPLLADVTLQPTGRTLILGAGGQLGRALVRRCPGADVLDLPDFDLGDPSGWTTVDWDRYEVVINAAAYTAVDAAETSEGRAAAWAINALAVARLCRVARQHQFTLVHVSTDYVFDGTRELHPEDEPFAPLGVYGQSKAAGDLSVTAVARHYLVRTSWVVGDGQNFVATMARLADTGVEPSVIEDQIGRLTFADDLAAGIVHLVTSGAAFGTYNLSSDGPAQSWADIAEAVFAARGRGRGAVTRVSTEEYGAGKAMAPRPPHSVLDLSKIKSVGFVPPDGPAALDAYLDRLPTFVGARPPQSSHEPRLGS
ncbi:bifunctional dTDP-4-dehydrorhamnose 3,5-epimerase family protein/NAD(P)-dependent oxidoreductase [Sporichthya sp.]|uniref:bifunctional dTDP-4-dehydrorhamnose 3,5-epimerase family protein/NAD(P)-dependent oxidoreductase n=1 Tax=Sporichthya sp. TaxID=65475 RepID=UPI00183322CC|nr:bifunctional dTDP-4-dehydrorhamnose 3,5-epimerase family protein/NAD(P)-dependent oxidoreductase [Sporichthya sp.]MBA3744924.1 sugar nucleotide-binding protein [Sporichthya sp.]